MKKYFVYILLLSNYQYYIGCTNDVKRRISEHNSGKTPSIRHKLPAKLIFIKEYDTFKEARRAESWIKKQKSRKTIEKILESGIIPF